ncbi:twin transmembrane helix small protein [Tepidicella baoligensis]|uniref:twin transmembrane helix small protein n=1 Tax=Tepidicella baoligensis TaxID=2707016 RepID=UPI0015DA2EFE|nr:twin transmembrane helix small protein [Tepidicella baoligensis]
MKWLIIVAFLLIIASLAGALVAMMRGDSASGDERRTRRMAKALTVRIGLSVLLFIAVIISYHLGWIQPTGLPMR